MEYLVLDDFYIARISSYQFIDNHFDLKRVYLLIRVLLAYLWNESRV
ncbi:hypothetical protein Tchl_0405 [Thauera chlorobenzoica]|uniref:Uncharacterized protein n=1 Tax=Thauera chlorobenzoica TaxID=96773 RepID=A0A1L6F8N3_9RHOO|nr:hypothetical protein Tchl_0405 [Thauera chlorobenzoica]